MRIWQEAGKKSSQWVAELEPEPGRCQAKQTKKCKADEAAENIGWVDRAAEGKKLVGGATAEQVNCIWLISGVTVTFLKKSMPRMGPATAACRKVDVNSLP